MIDTWSALNSIFSTDDLVYVAGPLKDEGGYSNPRLVALELAHIDILPEHCFFSINPLVAPTFNRNIRPDGTKGSIRASANVATFKNFLFESDSLPIDLQKQLMPVIAEHVPIRIATFSGSKSIHMIVSVADTLFSNSVKEPVQLYKQIWDGLHEKLDKVVRDYLASEGVVAPQKIFDTATKDPSRLSRLPGAIRNSIEQSVVYRGALVAGDELLALATEAKLKQYDGTKSSIDTKVDLSAFERTLRTTQSLQFLRDRLEYPDRWTSNANMYTEMFRYTLWCLDACSVSFPVLDTYFTKKVYPAILSKGYPRDPRAGVVAAYQFKGLY